jgi:hypothetical protein
LTILLPFAILLLYSVAEGISPFAVQYPVSTCMQVPKRRDGRVDDCGGLENR